MARSSICQPQLEIDPACSRPRMRLETMSRSYSGCRYGYVSTRISATWVSCAPACPSSPRFTWIDDSVFSDREGKVLASLDRHAWHLRQGNGEICITASSSY